MTLMMLLSPAKALDYQTPSTVSKYTLPQFLQQAQVLVDVLRPMNAVALSQLMGISEKLGVLNAMRFSTWQPKFDISNAKQAVLAFNGDVYAGLAAFNLNLSDLLFAQQYVRILSGLYGVLRPLDLMQPYRLEMGTKLLNPQGATLYAYWKTIITSYLNEQLSDNDVLINLASEEYFKAVDIKRLKARLIQPVFQDFKNDRYQTIGFYAKQARGLMVRYAVLNRILCVEKLKNFSEEGYQYDARVSTDNTWVYRRASCQS